MRKALLLCAFAALGTANAAEADRTLDLSHEMMHIAVPYGDLNLSRSAGAETMMFRIRSAATEACGGLPDIKEMRERKVFKGCFRQAVGQAVDELGAPLVTAAFERDLAVGRYS